MTEAYGMNTVYERYVLVQQIRILAENYETCLTLTSYFCTYHTVSYIEVLQFWIPPGRCITWEMGGVPVHHDPVDGIVANHEK
jgi:hypothetical protein